MVGEGSDNHDGKRPTGTRRLRVVLAVGVVGVLAAAAVVAVLITGASGSASYVGGTPPAGIRLPEFALSDAEGQRLASADLAGRVVVVTFLDVECTDACPVIAEYMRAGLDLLAAEQRERVVALAVSVDPEVDTADAVRAWLRTHRVEGDLHYLVGTLAELRPVWDAFRITSAFDSGDRDIHSAPVRIFDTAGEWVSTLYAGADLSADNLAHDVRAALNK